MLRKFNHGEVIFKEVLSLPNELKKITAKDFVVVGESETLGNDHRIEVLDDMEVYEKDGKLFLSVKTESKVFCPNEQRHDTKPLPVGNWEIDIAQEFDYLTEETRKVRD